MITRWRHNVQVTRRISHLSEALAALARSSPEAHQTSRSGGPVVPSIASLLSLRYVPAAEETITVNGFIRSVRKHARVAFAALQDGSATQSLQVVLKPPQAENLTNGAGVTIKGRWVPCPPGTEQSHELHASEVAVLGAADPDTYPIQKQYHTLEYLRSIPHLRTREPFNSLLLRLRSHMIARLTMYFAERDFVQAHPPVISSSDCEGAGEVFSITAENSEASSEENGREVEPLENDGRPRPRYLTVSSQLHLEALAQSVGKVWALAPTFRAEKSDTARHLSEFYMLEAEMGFTDRLAAIMDLVEDLLAELASDLSTSALGRELLLAKRKRDEREEEPPWPTAEQLQDRWQGMVLRNWPRISYTQAMHLLKDAEKRGDVQFEHPPGWETGLRTEHERYIADVVGQGRPVFVMHYPSHLKPFYMAASRNAQTTTEMRGQEPNTVACFDLLVPDLCELAGGSLREHRLDRLLESMQHHGLLKGPGTADAAAAAAAPSGEAALQQLQQHPNSMARLIAASSRSTNLESNATVRSQATSKPSHSLESQVDPAMQWYLDLRRWGSVPHGGFGLGFDRLLAYLAGVPNVKDVVTFPRWAGKGLC